jgi:hypothetical protein
VKGPQPFFDQKFEAFLAGEWDPVEALDEAAYATLAERYTPREIAALSRDNSTLEREIALQIFIACCANNTLSRAQVELLLSISKALVDASSDWKLKLGKRRAGRSHSLLFDEMKFERYRQIAVWLESQTSAGEKLEGAVAKIVDEHSIGRSTVFKIWKHRKFLREMDERADSILDPNGDIVEPKEPRSDRMQRLWNLLVGDSPDKEP